MEPKKEKSFDNPVRLAFRPSELDGIYKEIFKDDIARTLYLALSCGHLRSEFFPPNCLNAARDIKNKGAPRSSQEVNVFILGKFGVGYGSQLGEDLLPYLNGDRLLGYEFDPQKRGAPTLPNGVVIGIRKGRTCCIGQTQVDIYRVKENNGSSYIEEVGHIGLTDDSNSIGTKATLVDIIRDVENLLSEQF